MCGFVGIWQKDDLVSPSVIKRMTDIIAHRGPDSNGYYFDEKNKFALGFRRLSIIDLSEKGNQPISDDTGYRYIVFNGEIFNHKFIRNILQKKGFNFKSDTDTEIILYSYIDRGLDFVHELQGMFAFGIWDSLKTELLLVRDRIGIKPLYYFLSEKLFIFSSEIKSILLHPSVSKQIDQDALDDYLTYGYVPYDKSIIKNVKKLPAGHYLIKNDNGISIKKYWEVDYNPTTQSEDSILEELYYKIEKTVNLWTISDVPVGLFLSGGIDSSIVCASLNEQNRKEISAFSIGFDDKSRNEIKFAKIVADRFKLSHTIKIVEKVDAKNSINKLPFIFDEPFLDTSSVPTYFLAKSASKNFKVVLTGDGGDELFFGYSRYASLLKQFYLNSQKRFREPFIRIIHQLKKIPYLQRIESFEYNLTIDYYQLLFWQLCLFTKDEKTKIFNLEIDNNKDDLWLFKKFMNLDLPIVTSLRLLDLKTYLVDDILVKVDRATMINSLEARPPLLDHKLVEYVFTIPDHLIIKNNSKKYILKKCFEHKLPYEILHRKKKGFGSPIIYWFEHGLYDYAINTIKNGYLVKDRLLNFNELEKMIKHFTKRRWYKLWAVLILEKWYERWFYNTHFVD